MPTILPITPDANTEAVRRQFAQCQNSHVVLDLSLLDVHALSETELLARFRMLQRHAQVQGCQLGVITHNDSIAGAAKKTGLPVFASERDVISDRWRMHPIYPIVNPHKVEEGLPEAPRWRDSDIVARAAQPKAHRKRQSRIHDGVKYLQPMAWWLRLAAYAVMGLFMVAMLGAFAVAILPAATITVTPGREPIEVAVPMVADPDVEVSDVEAGIVPGRLVEINLESTGSAVTSGTQQKPVDKAVGTVVFSNLGNTEVRIPEGTVVSTSTGTPITFRTTQEATVESGVRARVSVPIEAEEPGISGNILANTINTVSGALRFRVSVSNPDATGGGGSQLVSVVTQQDKDALLAQVQSEAETQAYDSLMQELEPNEWMPRESVVVYTIAQEFDKFNDDEGETVQLKLRSLVQGTALQQTDAQQVLMADLRKSVPQHAMLVADSISFQDVGEVNSVGRQVEFTMTGKAEYVVPIDPVELKNAVTGKSIDNAVTEISQRWPLESVPDVYQDPEWLPTLPRFPNRIQVRIDYGSAGEPQ